MAIFEKPEDCAAFEWVLEEAIERTKTRLLAYWPTAFCRRTGEVNVPHAEA
jgi:hypothetical protein